MDDIEIYVKNRSLEDIQSWLEASFDNLTHLATKHRVHDYEAQLNHQTIPIMIVEQVVGKAWTSLWFKASGTPWKDDTDCAHSVHQQLQCQVRCNSGPWQEGADMDEWWQLDESGQSSIIKWPNA